MSFKTQKIDYFENRVEIYLRVFRSGAGGQWLVQKMNDNNKDSLFQNEINDLQPEILQTRIRTELMAGRRKNGGT